MKVSILFLVIFIIFKAHPSSREMSLPWSSPNQILVYRTCGCADTCWIAELKEKPSMEAKVRLRCDCQKLLVTLGPMAEEQIREANCKRFEDTSKFELISKEIKKILESK